MNFIVFPGQGSQKIGMGKKLSENFPEAKEVFDEVNDALNINLTKIMWEGSDSEISLTTNAQPALMACGVAAYRVLSKLENKNLKQLADFTCGHSLGEYTAMTVAKVFSLKECSILLRLRGEAMQKAVPVGKGAMAALIGISINQTNEIIEKAQIHGICDIGNDNADGQVVISGDIKAVENAIEIAKNNGAKRAILLPVSAPFHCQLMNSATEIMRNEIQKLNFQDSKIKLISNVTAKEILNKEELKTLLIDQIENRVRWRESVNHMIDNDVNHFIEIGPGKVLTGLIKRIDKNVKTNTINTENDIKNLML